MPIDPRQECTLRQLLSDCASNQLGALLWAEGLMALAPGQALALNPEALQAAVEGLEVGLLLTDELLQPLYANPALLRLTGHDQAGLARLAPPSSWQFSPWRAATPALSTAWQAGQVWRGSVRLPAAAGHHLEAQAAIYPLRNEQCELACLAWVLHDCTEAARQARLSAMNTLAGQVAHDLNNLLTVQVAYSQMMVEDAPPTGLLYHAATAIQSAVRRMTALSEKLMFSSGRITPGSNLVELGERLRGLAPELDEMAGPEITLEIRCAPEPLSVRAEPEHLELMLSNLVANAVAAAGPGGSVTVQAWRCQAADACGDQTAGEFALLAVSDTGPGLAPDMVDHLFEPFYAHQRGGVGTGLGLAVARGIVLAQGGTIRLAANGGDTGARVEVMLPLAKR